MTHFHTVRDYSSDSKVNPMGKKTRIMIALWVGGALLFCMLFLLRNAMNSSDGLLRIWVIGISAITAFLCFRYMMTD